MCLCAADVASTMATDGNEIGHRAMTHSILLDHVSLFFLLDGTVRAVYRPYPASSDWWREVKTREGSS
jgi:membrane-bound metal-dependent hydrolase YbcI (DUF457 family)